LLRRIESATSRTPSEPLPENPRYNDNTTMKKARRIFAIDLLIPMPHRAPQKHDNY
jgi:hypothetical protein